MSGQTSCLGRCEIIRHIELLDSPPITVRRDLRAASVLVATIRAHLVCVVRVPECADVLPDYKEPDGIGKVRLEGQIEEHIAIGTNTRPT